MMDVAFLYFFREMVNKMVSKIVKESNFRFIQVEKETIEVSRFEFLSNSLN